MMKTFDDYFSKFDQELRTKLESIRKEVKKESPDAEECIKYLMPTFVLKNQNLIHFAAFKNHIGLYPGPEAVSFFENELEKFKTSKGAVQIPLSEKIPLTLIRKLVHHAKERILKSTKTTNK